MANTQFNNIQARIAIGNTYKSRHSFNVISYFKKRVLAHPIFLAHFYGKMVISLLSFYCIFYQFFVFMATLQRAKRTWNKYLEIIIFSPQCLPDLEELHINLHDCQSQKVFSRDRPRRSDSRVLVAKNIYLFHRMNTNLFQVSSWTQILFKYQAEHRSFQLSGNCN